jgi:hypothetical protein
MPLQSAATSKKRPFWVWIISGFFLFSGVMNLSTLLLIHTGQAALPPAELAKLQQSATAWTLAGILPAANLAGAVALFLLRKIAFAIFTGMFAASIANGFVQFLLLDRSLRNFSAQGVTQVLLGWGILLAVCIYSHRLKRQGVLY